MSAKLARIEIQKMAAYQSARSLKNNGSVFLDANESPFTPLAGLGLNRYPEPQPEQLVKRLSHIYQVPSQNLLVGRGSDEAIDLVVRVFCRPGEDQILICPPTYGMYEISAKIQNAGIIRVPLRIDGLTVTLDEESILIRIKEGVKILFLCSPNNPTGTAFPREALKRICEAALEKTIVVIDEAYSEFSNELSMISEINRYPNLIVLRTLSKAWAAAGVRCGVALGQEPLIQLLQKVRAPYPLSQPASEAALLATNSESKRALHLRTEQIKIARDEFGCELKKLECVDFILPSSTNFLLVRFKDAKSVMKAAAGKEIVLRDRSSEAGLSQCIRITVGTRDENKQVLEMLRQDLK